MQPTDEEWTVKQHVIDNLSMTPPTDYTLLYVRQKVGESQQIAVTRIGGNINAGTNGLKM